jgi:hypothetical protein
MMKAIYRARRQCMGRYFFQPPYFSCTLFFLVLSFEHEIHHANRLFYAFRLKSLHDFFLYIISASTAAGHMLMPLRLLVRLRADRDDDVIS